MMKTFPGISSGRLQELVGRFRSLRIAVLGDFFLDKYLDVDPRLAEVSVETGKTAHQVVAVRHSPGAAGTVVCNLAALGAGTLHAIGFTGEDGEGWELRRDLAALGCRTEHLHCDPQSVTPTYLKPRDGTVPGLAGEHSRYDTKNRRPTAVAMQHRMVASLDRLLPDVDAVILADQVEQENLGVFTARLIDAADERAKRWPQVIFWADSRNRIRRFRHVIIKPNQFEAAGRVNLPGEEVDLEELQAALAELRTQTGSPICATRGPHGMVVTDPEMTVVRGVRVEGPVDPTGAGDSAAAGCVLALAAGASLPEAALVGNLVASITVQQLATTGTARPEELGPRLEMWRAQG